MLGIDKHVWHHQDRRRRGPHALTGIVDYLRGGSSHVKRNDSVRPSWRMRRISVSKSPTTAPSKCARSSIKPRPPKADAWQHTSSSAYQPVPSPKSPDWVEPLRKWKDALDAYFDTGGASNTPHRSHQRNHRTGQTHRQRLPQSHQLPTPNAPHHRRPRCLNPHSTLKSPCRAARGGIHQCSKF